jgi:copper homeostasis protein
MLLEVIVCSVRDAIEAERGGAGRLELVRDLHRGGMTPSVELVEAVLSAVTIPVRVMIREADGYDAGDPRQIEQLAGLARRVGSLGVQGLVCGFTRDGRIDVPAVDTVAQACGSAWLTFHHAFDDLPDPTMALRELQQWPCVDRVLTSGGPGDWKRKAERMREWAGVTARIGILGGGGVDLAALRVLSVAGLAEVHVGRAARDPATVEGAVTSSRVAELVMAAAASAGGQPAKPTAKKS